MEYIGKGNDQFEIYDLVQNQELKLSKPIPSEFSLWWFQDDCNSLEVDNVKHTFFKNDILCLTEFHTAGIQNLNRVKILKWTKNFYWIINHDSEVSCKGILIYGAAQLPVIKANNESDLETFSLVWKLLEKEMLSNDSLQGEMLQMMLKIYLLADLSRIP